MLKNGFIALALIALPFLSSFKTENSLLGYWEVSKVIKKGETASTDRIKFLHFMEDRSMKSGTIADGHTTQMGQWNYDLQSRNLKIMSVGENKDDGDYLVIRLNASEMILSKEEVLIFLDRGK